jgi:hypothetical protein
MNSTEIKKLIIGSLNAETDAEEIARRLDDEYVSFNFRKGFSGKVIDRIFAAGIAVNQEIEFVKNMNYIFYRIAFPGVAAIVLLLISIFLMQGSLSINTFLGLTDTYDESIVCLLTGN